jgi:hypothetical protein
MHPPRHPVGLSAPTHPVRQLRALLLPGAGAAVWLSPAPAWAHVKWFAPYDVAEPPLSLSGVLSRNFLLVVAGFTLLLFAGFLLDRLAARSGRGAAGTRRCEHSEEKLLRAATGAFFMALFATGGVILTPELKTGAEWPVWLQLGIAASMLSARSCVVGAAGILVLYGYAVARYGVFHLADYPMFLGFAAYMALTSIRPGRLRALRMPILCASLSISLMWASVEKWAYPHWTYPLLEARPYLTLGIAPHEFMVLAGFVEFALAFYILTGLGLLRLGTAGLGLIFVAAILDFGRLDAIGHLPTIAALAALYLHGPTRLHHWLHDAQRSPLAEARRQSLSFTAAICVFFIAYYGLQHAEYGRHAGLQGGLAALAAPGQAR